MSDFIKLTLCIAIPLLYAILAYLLPLNYFIILILILMVAILYVVLAYVFRQQRLAVLSGMLKVESKEVMMNTVIFIMVTPALMLLVVFFYRYLIGHESLPMFPPPPIK